MKIKKECVKCNSTDILRIPGEVGAYGVGNNVRAGLVSAVTVTRYLCISCGYSEEWIDKKEDIEKLQKKYGGKNEII